MTTTTAPMKITKRVTAKVLKWTTGHQGSTDFQIFVSDDKATNSYWAINDRHPLFPKLAATFPHDSGKRSTGYTGRSIAKAERIDPSQYDVSIDSLLPLDSLEEWTELERGPDHEVCTKYDPWSACYMVRDTRRKAKRQGWALNSELIDLIAGPGAVISYREGRPHGPWRIDYAGETVGWVMPIVIP